MNDRALKLDPELAIRVRGICKAYKYYHRNSDLLREIISGRKHHEEHWALRNIAFDVPKGSVVGIVGPNGSGKSTLLKIITGLLDATAGTVEVNGRVSAILELGTGFHPDFTGRQNIITGGLCLGMSRDEIDAKIPWIIDFSELASVIDQPFKTYSSGMQARLTFSTAISINPEVFIVDEALAAGDAFFVAKTFKRIRDICKSGATVLFVSHGTGQVAQLCDLAIWLDKGTIRSIGPAREVAKQYDYDTHVRISEGAGQIITFEEAPTKSAPENSAALAASNVGQTSQDDLSKIESLVASENTEFTLPETSVSAENKREIYRKGPVVIDRVRIFGTDGIQRTTFRTWEDVTVEVHYSCPADYLTFDTLGFAIGIERESDLVLIAQFNTVNYVGNETIDYHDAPYRKIPATRGIVRAFLPRLQMMNGSYLLSLGLIPNQPGTSDFYEYHHRTYPIRIITSGYPSGAAFYPTVEWSHEYLQGSLTALSPRTRAE